MKLIVGLGNPGPEYAQTRHNAGFIALDFLRQHYAFDEFKTLDKGKSLITKGEMGGEKVILVKPQTFMNRSGIPAQAVASYFKIDVADVIAIYDEAELPFGTLRIRIGGSAGGHNGVKSLIEQLGADFLRFKIGIKPEKPFPGALEDYVLGKLMPDEQDKLMSVIQMLPEALETLFTEGAKVAMNRYN